MRVSIRLEIEAEYENQRAQNHAEEARRLRDAIGRDPEIGQLVKKRVKIFQDGAREAFANPASAQSIAAALGEAIETLQSELKARLLSAGLPADYLHPVYACAICHDSGYTGETVRVRCACYQQKLKSRAVRNAGLGLNPSETFAAFNAAIFPDTPLRERPQDTQRSYIERMRMLCEDYADSYPHVEKTNLLMTGGSGLGKTFLLNCVGNRLHDAGIPVIKVTAYQLSERMRASVFEHDPSAFSEMIEIPVLLLDDLGVEPILNNITLEHLFTLLNERMLARRHTIISTNLDPFELKNRYSERIISRLLDKHTTRILPFHGTDVRLR